MIAETFLVASILAVVLVAMASTIGRSSKRRAVQVSAVLLCLGTAWVAAGLRTPVLTEAETPFRPVAVPADGFVSSDTCQSCHPDQYDTWHDSYHRKMTQPAGPESILGTFEGTVLTKGSRTYELGRDGDIFYVDLEVDGQKVRRPILMTTGSHTVQGYWYPTGDRRNIALLPFVYLVKEHRWVPRRSVFILPPQKTTETSNAPKGWPNDQRWNHTCIHCHTTHGRPNFEDLDTKVSEFGIACESCHGPAEEHLRRVQEPWSRYSRHLGGSSDDDPIVNPVHLDKRRASEVCGVCHGITYPRGEEIYQDLEGGRRFRPGDDLDETRRLVQPSLGEESLAGLPEAAPGVREQSFWSDGLVRVKGREFNDLVETPCYQRGEMTCFSCHEMHQKSWDQRPRLEWANDQLKPGFRDNRACTQCHGDYADEAALTAHTKHLAGSTGSNCYNCHMPFTTFGLLKAIRSHAVTNPSVTVSVKTGRPDACSSCHLDKSLGWTARRLEEQYGIETRDLDAVRESVPASLVWMLAGDAAQRSLMAWHMRLPAAREVSGTHWMTPFLAQLLVDPYDGVRFNALEALKMQPGFEDLDIDFLDPEEERAEAATQIMDRWAALLVPEGEVADALRLIEDPNGVLPADIYTLLLMQRNDRLVALSE